VTLSWVLFRSPSLADAMAHYTAMFHPARVGIGVELWRVVNLFLPFVPVIDGLSQPQQLAQVAGFIAVVGISLFAPNSQQIALWLAARRVKALAMAELPMLAGVLLVLALAFISPNTVTPFIYFQF
jgi:hypothetical protein